MCDERDPNIDEIEAAKSSNFKLLLRSAFDPVAQVLCGKRVPILVQEKVLAMRSFGALVSEPGNTLAAIQLGALCYAFDDHFVAAIGSAARIGKYQVWKAWLSASP